MFHKEVVLGPILYTADLPINNNVIIATDAGDTVILAINKDPEKATLIQSSINDTGKNGRQMEEFN